MIGQTPHEKVLAAIQLATGFGTLGDFHRYDVAHEISCAAAHSDFALCTCEIIICVHDDDGARLLLPDGRMLQEM